VRDDRLQAMFRYFSFLCLLILGGLVAIALARGQAVARLPFASAFALGTDGRRGRGSAAGPLPAPRPVSFVQSPPLRAAANEAGVSRLHLSMFAAAVVGLLVVGAVAASAFVFSGESADGPTACEDFGHVQAFLAGGAAGGGSPTLAERILDDDADESTRVMQLRAMFDRCYYSSKK
jgi:hypothetical protein